MGGEPEQVVNVDACTHTHTATVPEQWQLSLQQAYRIIISAAAAVGLEVFIVLWHGEAVRSDDAYSPTRSQSSTVVGSAAILKYRDTC